MRSLRLFLLPVNTVPIALSPISPAWQHDWTQLKCHLPGKTLPGHLNKVPHACSQHTHTCTHSTHIYAHTCTQTYAHTIHIYAHTCTHTRMRAHTCTHVHTYAHTTRICAHRCMHTHAPHTCAHMHIHADTRAHTYTHTLYISVCYFTLRHYLTHLSLFAGPPPPQHAPAAAWRQALPSQAQASLPLVQSYLFVS